MKSDLPNRLISTLAPLAVLLAAVAVPVWGDEPAAVPPAWREAWQNPPADCRPLQIVHGIHAKGTTPAGIGQMLHDADPARVALENMRYYKNLGLGGIVCNVAFDRYLESEENWQALARAMKACQDLGLIVWLYDEKGYPSGSAGGLVLRENRQLEALELAYDASLPDPFLLRPAFEHTHASNNYHAVRRYINLIDDRAVETFLAKTHAAYWQRLEPFFGRTIQATFTDEPSLITVNLGQIPEPARQRVPVDDPTDPAVRPLPAVPWCYDLAERYRQRYREDLLAQRKSLFVGDREDDRRIRRQFWSLIADLVADRYFGAIETWCSQHRVASSGHSLWEEDVLHHVTLEGNGLKVLGRMQIPGLDVLSSDPEAVIHSGWMTAGLPGSAGMLNGRRRLMTEVSDFSQKMSGRGPASLADMQATAAWQAAWGVTEFTLYYGIADRSAADFHAYCDYVGRLNSLLRPAQPVREVLLYYPIYDLWSEYVPVAAPLRLESQSPRAKRLVSSFMRLGQLLERNQVPFTLVDHEHLAAARALPGGKLAIGEPTYHALVVPEDVVLPEAAAAVVEAFAKQGGVVLRDQPAERLAARSLADRLKPAFRVAPASERIALGRFRRDGREIVLVANVAATPYEGRLSTGMTGRWQLFDPATGVTRPVERLASGEIPLSLAARQAVLLIGEAMP